MFHRIFFLKVQSYEKPSIPILPNKKTNKAHGADNIASIEGLATVVLSHILNMSEVYVDDKFYLEVCQTLLRSSTIYYCTNVWWTMKNLRAHVTEGIEALFLEELLWLMVLKLTSHHDLFVSLILDYNMFIWLSATWFSSLRITLFIEGLPF